MQGAGLEPAPTYEKTLMIYRSLYFENDIHWDLVSPGELNFYNWEAERPYHPKTSFRLAFSKNFLAVHMVTNETELRAVNTDVDSPCYEDSCMEFFFAPFGTKNGYINIEVNPLSAYLAEFGKARDGRRLLSELTPEKPAVFSSINENGWETNINVPYSLIESVFKRPFDPLDCDFYADFFKCGDLTSHPHWLSYTAMGENPPGFHNPSCFEKVEIHEK